MRLSVPALLATLFLGLPAAKAQGVKIVKEFKGEAPAAKLEKTVGGTSYFQSPAAFKAFWDASGLKGTMPKVDFAKQMVIRGYAREAKDLALDLKLSAKGDLTVTETKKDGPSVDVMSFHIVIINRDGVKTVNGRKIRE
jgi:hypothetical protein